MIPLQVECAGRAEPVALQLKPPCRLTDTEGKFRVLCRPRCHFKTGERRAGLRRTARAQEEARDAAIAGAKRQTAARGEIEDRGIAPHFRDRRRKTGATQSLLEDPERFAGLLHADNQQPTGIESEPRKAGTVWHACFACRTGLADPENRTRIAVREKRDQPRDKTMRRTGGANLCAANLMQRAEQEPAPQRPVEWRDTKRQKPGALSGRSRG
jgi:hypothetical protein